MSCCNKYVGGKRFILTKLLMIEQVVCTFENYVFKVISCIYPCGPFKLYPIQYKELSIPLSNTVHASLHRALRSLKPIDLTSSNDFGVIGMGVSSVSLLSFTILHPLTWFLHLPSCLPLYRNSDSTQGIMGTRKCR